MLQASYRDRFQYLKGHYLQLYQRYHLVTLPFLKILRVLLGSCELTD